MTFKQTRPLIVLLALMGMMFAWRLTPTARADAGLEPGAPLAAWSVAEQGGEVSQAAPENPSEPTALTLVTLSTRTDSSTLVIFGGVLLVAAAVLIIVAAWRSHKEARIR